MGGLSPHDACPPVDCAILRILLGALVPGDKPQYPVLRSTAAHGAPHGAQHACGGVGGFGRCGLDVWEINRTQQRRPLTQAPCARSAAVKSDWSARRAVFPAAQASCLGTASG